MLRFVFIAGCMSLALAAGQSTAQEVLPAAPLSLDAVEAIALESHPAIAEAAARVRAARGNCLQVGLPPNPTIGYTASEIGDDDSAGQQGMYAGQTFIRGNKLGLNRQVALQQIREKQQQLAVEQLRVLTAVRIAFYDVYLAQRQVELSEALVAVSAQANKSVKQLFEAQEARRIDVLQADIELERIGVKLAQARATQQAAWRQLSVAMGQPNLDAQSVEADPAKLEWTLNWEASRQLVLDSSPELAALMFDVSRARAALARACVEPIPDVTAQVSVQQDTATDYTIAGVQVGMPVPLWNRNQGGIRQARAELTAAQRKLEAVELDLTAQLAQRMREFEAAKAQADAYQDGILRRAEENMELTQQSYDAGEATYLELLTVQRTYFESNLDYLATLGQVNRSVQTLAGLLVGTRGD
ncbi:TolC family protein [Aeoliella sp.]|uniref:TolC family protein n=1 Tax=Aeoliella sp. TaxID=2795800 RepID=UPI003CCC2043